MYQWFDYYWQAQYVLAGTPKARLVAEPYGLKKRQYGVFLPTVIKK